MSGSEASRPEPGASASYCLISPCRNEALHLQRTLDTVAAQTVPPSLWVIVDDGSTDATPDLLNRFAESHAYVRIVRREDRGRRSVGPGVIDAFYAGLESVDVKEFDYLCKLDVDLELPPRYFEILIQRMKENPRIGTCSGKAYYRDETSGALVSEGIGDDVSVGASKFYRRACFEETGGFIREVMWDGIDSHRCRMLGWIACSWDDPDIRFIHLRPMGTSDKGIVRGRLRHGYGQYFMGTHLAFMTASALYRMTRPPRIIGGFCMWWGYVISLLLLKPRYPDREFRRFLRRYQWSCLFRGKRRALATVDRDGERRWSERRGRPQPAP